MSELSGIRRRGDGKVQLENKLNAKVESLIQNKDKVKEDFKDVKT